MWAAIALAFGLAMDATAVSAARGLGARRAREAVILPLLFGAFQAGMAALGWIAGSSIGPYIATWDHWVAFGLLVAIGGKMILDGWPPCHGAARSGVRAGARGGDDDAGAAPGTAMLYLGLAVATSIDAAAAGLTLPVVPVAPWISLAWIGGVTAACSLGGFFAGRVAGKRFGAGVTVLGGVVLIAIGVQLLVRHL